MDGNSLGFAVLPGEAHAYFLENLISYRGNRVNNYQFERKDLSSPEAGFLVDCPGIAKSTELGS
jgi:hypothetical protein